MKRFIPIAAACILLCSCNVVDADSSSTSERLIQMERGSVEPVMLESNDVYAEEQYVPLNYDVQKGIWLSYIDLAPMLTGKSKEKFTENFSQACENISELGCNTVYVHARPFGDALYDSSLYPSSAYITGEIDDVTDFDPLEIICDTAHKYKLSVHAWINPLRCALKTDFDSIGDKFAIKNWYNENSDKLRSVNGDDHLWLNPAYPEVRKLIAGGAAEICENYEVDGIHLDDYFYPTTEESFDSECFAQSDTKLSLESWRMDNITKMCEEIYSAVKGVSNDIEVGISPQGNIENNYEFMYADVKSWCREGDCCDYIVPQIYFGYDNTVKPFSETFEEWQSITENGKVSLICGLGVYKIGLEDEFTDTDGIIAQQIKDSISVPDCSGIALYSYGSLFAPASDIEDRMDNEAQKIAQTLKHFN